ncbi:RING-type E3 ubiquitin transferase [Purpureocillium takamizusanense]|uniref:RING-type E3 ubiquitin transferase n=1 Tax=Purpureocillium takamizusanense TaxID=2060973 RepID=A0A9Q8QI83_9HYPO|nr:RING-type E3 ubiquitin transferase [Purpureocillium takamizusanense]UNI19336.1 RING-type E3 ubiquitin transferase [Purpureocillium takamizusanense]
MDRSEPRPSRPSANLQAQPPDAAPAICRICRGEGTAAEPLFYPCKCSGSIKFVHQDCLMEWLSHSQKKYCELCKTSFRFTKLYAPDMPKSLPVHVFLEHMARYLLRNVLVWLRAFLSISVWVCWLPWFMRAVWSFMFWISDEGLGGASLLSRANTAVDTSSWLSAAMADIGTTPVTPLLPQTTTSAAEAAVILQGLGSEDMSEYLVRLLLGSWGMPVKFGRSAADVAVAANSSASASNNVTAASSSSLLGDVGFLKQLTPSPILNRTIVSVLEGQIITILVIVCFILVILVRDYVVQQQPEINMRAAFDDPEGDDLGDQPVEQEIGVRVLREAGESDSEGEAPEDAEARRETGIGQEPEAGPARAATETGIPVVEEDLGRSSQEASLLSDDARDQLAHRSASSDDDSDDPSSVIEYLRIYRRASGDSERILQIVEEEGLEEKLSYWVDVTRRSITKREDVAREFAIALDPDTGYRTRLGDAGPSDPDNGPNPFEADQARDETKGKERAWEPVSPGSTPGPQLGSSSRPRSISDGPQPHSTVNPLGSNNWSFAGLSSGDVADNHEPQLPTPPAESSAPLLENGTVSEPSNDDLVAVEHDTYPLHESSDEEDGREQHWEPAHPPDEAPAQPERQRAGLGDRVANFMWGNLDDQHDAPEADDHADEDGWVDVPVDEEQDDNVDADGNAVDVDGAAPGLGLDPEAIEDMEDFEGVMELIGMRGPIAGLFQNAIFCAVLVSVTIFACIFIPYNIGRLTVWIVANPMQLLRMLLEFSKVVQDAGVMVGGLGSWCALNFVDMFTGIVGGAVGAKVVSARKASWGVWTAAGKRVMEYALLEFPMSATEMQNFSAISHEALNSVKASIVAAFGSVDAVTAARASLADGTFMAAAAAAVSSAAASAKAVAAMLVDPGSWVIDLSASEARSPVDPALAHWTGLDRFWAILTGYVAIFAIGAMYLKRGTPFSRGNMLQAWEAGVIDTLHQASGIMKVILIISIEMLVFPLYCGLLLDIALLPLFEDTTVRSRILFTSNYPLTSVFVHWFVGTGYMFHFALFVSMCRKIMRPGVLYFIRDPDDPEFHPVRDVLERNLATQLRKILFSAFVYGALVIVCLGGVVWGLSYSAPGVLPIHYSSNEPVLEFPVDLLFYNFLMPLAVKVFKPGDGLHIMYTWWFRKCARGLRLTYFLFGERRIDEEGDLKLPADFPDAHSRYRTLLLELDEHNRVIPKTWRDTFEGGRARPNTAISSREERIMRRRKLHLVTSGQLVKSGRFVRAPASDRVKIPKGKKVFLTVSETGRRRDGNPDDDIYSSNQYQMVYIPPSFRTRVFLFILFIWLFAAVTGVGFTVLPLMFGRAMFKTLIPEGIRTNDVYAFSIGIYVLGNAAYGIFRARTVAAKVRNWAHDAWAELVGHDAAKRIFSGVVRAAKLCYAHVFLLIVFPLLFSTLMELYVSIPLHTYMKSGAGSAGKAEVGAGAGADRHTVRIIQAWTLGVLYLNLGTRMLASVFPASRAATAVRSVLRRGWLRPDIAVLTRAFVVPGIAIALAAILGPPMMASLLIKANVLSGETGVDRSGAALVYRYSYPAAALAALAVRHAVGMAGVFKGWKVGIRDEAYLIGERLHNFGAATAGARRGKRAWASGRPRL